MDTSRGYSHKCDIFFSVMQILSFFVSLSNALQFIDQCKILHMLLQLSFHGSCTNLKWFEGLEINYSHFYIRFQLTLNAH